MPLITLLQYSHVPRRSRNYIVTAIYETNYCLVNLGGGAGGVDADLPVQISHLDMGFQD